MPSALLSRQSFILTKKGERDTTTAPRKKNEFLIAFPMFCHTQSDFCWWQQNFCCSFRWNSTSKAFIKLLILLQTKTFFFSSCLLTFASERGIFFLQELHVQNTWLTRVPPSIRNLTQLQVLDIETSRVSFLPDGTFEGMKALQDLKIADASVSQVSDSVFSGLRKLKRLSLYKNNITSLARVSLLCCSIDPKTETAGWQLANRHFSKNKTGSIWTQ